VEVFESVTGDLAVAIVELAMLVMIEVDELLMVELKFVDLATVDAVPVDVHVIIVHLVDLAMVQLGMLAMMIMKLMEELAMVDLAILQLQLAMLKQSGILFLTSIGLAMVVLDLDLALALARFDRSEGEEACSCCPARTIEGLPASYAASLPVVEPRSQCPFRCIVGISQEHGRCASRLDSFIIRMSCGQAVFTGVDFE